MSNPDSARVGRSPTPEGLREWLADAVEDMAKRAREDGETDAPRALDNAAQFIRETEVHRLPDVPSNVSCPTCSGLAEAPPVDDESAAAPPPCPDCKGKGYVLLLDSTHASLPQSTAHNCKTCHGSGKVYDTTRGPEGGEEDCPSCLGEGDDVAPVVSRPSVLERLMDATNGLLGHIQLIAGRDDLPVEIAELLQSGHRWDEAHAAVDEALGALADVAPKMGFQCCGAADPPCATAEQACANKVNYPANGGE